MKYITLPRVLLVLFVALVGGFAFLLLAPVEPLKINSVRIEGTNFKAGGELSFTIDRCKNVSSAVPGTASRYFVDANDKTKADIFISSTDDLGEKGCAIVKRTIDIPSHIKDGVYRLKFVTRYYPSVLREPVKIEYTTEETFTIKGQELSAQLNNIYEQLRVLGAKPVASTLMIPTPQTITPPFSEPALETPAQPIPTPATPEQSCVINVIGIKLLCN